MARINRSDVIQRAVNDLGISTSTEKVPTETLDKVQLVYLLNRQNSNFIIGGTVGASGSGGADFPTASAGGEIYLNGITASIIKDATCDVADGIISFTIVNEMGIAQAIISFPVLTLTAQNQSITLNFPQPFKVKSGSSILTSATYTVGKMQRNVIAWGYKTSSN